MEVEHVEVHHLLADLSLWEGGPDKQPPAVAYLSRVYVLPDSHSYSLCLVDSFC
jgi:hypothetical protein